MSRSEVWSAHFSDNATFCDQETVEVKDASPTAFQKLLQWVDGNCPQLPSMAVVFDLLYLAEKYLIDDLQNLLLKKIKEHLHNIPSNSFLVSELNKTNNEEVLEIVLTTVDNNILPLILDPKHLSLDFATVSLVLSRPSLHCDENRLARWLLAWAKHNQPDDQQANDLCSLIKWEQLTETDVRELALLSEHATGHRFWQQVGVHRLTYGKSRLGGLQMVPGMRSERRYSEKESDKSSLWPKTSAKPTGQIMQEHEYPTSLALPLRQNIFDTSHEQDAFPVILCPDGDTLIRPLISWTEHYKGLKVEILILGSMGGLRDTANHHVMDLQLRLELAYVAGNGLWTRSEAPELDDKNQTCFPLNGNEMQEDLLSGGKTFNGLLKIFQFKRSGEDPGWSSGTESEGEGDDLQDFSEDEDDDDVIGEDGDDLDGFIVDDNEDEEPAEEENEDNDSEREDNNEDGAHSNYDGEENIGRGNNSGDQSNSSEDEESPIKSRKKGRRRIDSDSEEEPDVKQKKGEEEESEYETDDDMGEVAENRTPEPGRTPEPDYGEAEEGSGRIHVTFSEEEEHLGQPSS